MQWRPQIGHFRQGRPALSENPSGAAQRPTAPSPTQSGISKPNAPTKRGIETGTACSTAVLIAGCSMKSHLISMRVPTLSAFEGFLSATRIACRRFLPPFDRAGSDEDYEIAIWQF